MLEHQEVPHWHKLLERLLADKEMLAGVRLKFGDIYKEIEGSTDPSAALELFLGELPVAKKDAVGRCVETDEMTVEAL